VIELAISSAGRCCFAFRVLIRLHSVFRQDVKLLQLIQASAQLGLAKSYGNSDA
jgi:hypothetical protein